LFVIFYFLFFNLNFFFNFQVTVNHPTTMVTQQSKNWRAPFWVMTKKTMENYGTQSRRKRPFWVPIYGTNPTKMTLR